MAREQAGPKSNLKSKTIHEKAPSTREYLLTAIWESWNHFTKGNCFKLEQSKSSNNERQLSIDSYFLSMNSIVSLNIGLFHKIFFYMVRKIISLIEII